MKMQKSKKPIWPWIVGAVAVIAVVNAVRTGGEGIEETAPAVQQTPAPKADKKPEAIDAALFSIKCEEQIRKQLKLPDTARFSNITENVPVIKETTATYQGWVEAENSFGGKVRNNFTCSYDKPTSMLTAKIVD